VAGHGGAPVIPATGKAQIGVGAGQLRHKARPYLRKKKKKMKLKHKIPKLI
jgi:hypothetical protein